MKAFERDDDSSAISDDSGVFRMPCAHADAIVYLEVSAAGHPKLYVASEEVSGNWRALELHFPKGAVVRGRIVDEHGRAVAAARIQARYAVRKIWLPEVASSAADGRFELGALPEGELVVQVWKQVSEGRWQPWTAAALTLAEGETRDQDFAFGAEPADLLPVGPLH